MRSIANFCLVACLFFSANQVFSNVKMTSFIHKNQLFLYVNLITSLIQVQGDLHADFPWAQGETRMYRGTTDDSFGELVFSMDMKAFEHENIRNAQKITQLPNGNFFPGHEIMDIYEMPLHLDSGGLEQVLLYLGINRTDPSKKLVAVAFQSHKISSFFSGNMQIGLGFENEKVIFYGGFDDHLPILLALLKDDALGKEGFK